MNPKQDRIKMRTTGWNLREATMRYQLPHTHAGYVEAVTRALFEFAGIEREPLPFASDGSDGRLVRDETAPEYIAITRSHLRDAMLALIIDTVEAGPDEPGIEMDMINAALTFVAVDRRPARACRLHLAEVANLALKAIDILEEDEDAYKEFHAQEIEDGETQVPDLAARLTKAIGHPSSYASNTGEPPVFEGDCAAELEDAYQTIQVLRWHLDQHDATHISTLTLEDARQYKDDLEEAIEDRLVKNKWNGLGTRSQIEGLSTMIHDWASLHRHITALENPENADGE